MFDLDTSGWDMSVRAAIFYAALLAAAMLAAFNLSIAFFTRRHKPVRRASDRRPVLVGSAGVLYDDTLKALGIPRADVEQALRDAHCALADMQLAVLETDGNISILQEASDPMPGLAVAGAA